MFQLLYAKMIINWSSYIFRTIITIIINFRRLLSAIFQRYSINNHEQKFEFSNISSYVFEVMYINCAVIPL